MRLPTRTLLLLWFLAISVQRGLAHDHLYRVEAGDTLFSIARRFEVTLDHLAAWNALTDLDRLEVGQILRLAPPGLETLSLPDEILEMRLEPEQAVQGRVQVLELRLDETSEVAGYRYLGDELPVTGALESGVYRVLLPVPVLAEPGWGTLTVRLSSAASKSEVDVPIFVLDGGFAREEIWLSESASRLLEPAIVDRENWLMETICLARETKARWQGPFQYPVQTPTVTSRFGTLRSYNGGPYRNFHRGLDLRGDPDTLVSTAAGGTVILAETLTVRGNTVIVDHGLGVCSGYMHLDRITVELGDALEAGDPVGFVGATGLVTGSHLHWEVRVSGVPVSPGFWVDPGVRGLR
ncbi:MAG: peptidoglycan DD-metalloendopeptidase family protein [Trueperaceae bacterium]|nr:MAG: peptidoglycan DD-metalloendopeptidase family protein [Trueperaceae bacterium]